MSFQNGQWYNPPPPMYPPPANLIPSQRAASPLPPGRNQPSYGQMVPYQGSATPSLSAQYQQPQWFRSINYDTYIDGATGQMAMYGPYERWNLVYLMQFALPAPSFPQQPPMQLAQQPMQYGPPVQWQPPLQYGPPTTHYPQGPPEHPGAYLPPNQAHVCGPQCFPFSGPQGPVHMYPPAPQAIGRVLEVGFSQENLQRLDMPITEVAQGLRAHHANKPRERRQETQKKPTGNRIEKVKAKPKMTRDQAFKYVQMTEETEQGVSTAEAEAGTKAMSTYKSVNIEDSDNEDENWEAAKQPWKQETEDLWKQEPGRRALLESPTPPRCIKKEKSDDERSLDLVPEKDTKEMLDEIVKVKKELKSEGINWKDLLPAEEELGPEYKALIKAITSSVKV